MRAMRLAVMAGMVVLAVGCSAGSDNDTGGLPAFTAPPSGAAVAPPGDPPPSAGATPPTGGDADQIVAAYRDYTAAVSAALAAGDPGLPRLDEVTSGQARKDARARVRANRDAGLVTSGELTPSATAATVDWDGGDRATVTDCVLNGLAHVSADDPSMVETEATGTRRPVEARLTRAGDRWVVSRVEMPQDDAGDNAQRDPPFLRGPMPDGPPSCAPPDLEQELLARYQAFWDAFDHAFGFGRDGPANPDDPALAETSTDPQLSDSREFFQKLKDKNQTSRGERDTRDPWVLGVTDFDATAFIGDCVALGDSQTVDLDDGTVKERNDAGRLDLERIGMQQDADAWRVSSRTTEVEGLVQCPVHD